MSGLRLASALAVPISVLGFAILAQSPPPPEKTTSVAKAVKVDQVGYQPDAPKIAIVVPNGRGAPPTSFFVRRADTNGIAFRGRLTQPVFDADSGDNVQTADFSALHDSGRFYVEVPGQGWSWTFAIAPDVFNRVYFLTMRAYYGQRCGTAVDLGPDFPAYKHGPCHLVGAYGRSSGKQGPHVSTHGWHDAGDYGRYMTNAGISTGTLLWAWEMYSAKIGKIGLQIPESGNGTPDILNESRWNLDWMLTMQGEDGGVWHKQTSDHFCGFIMPEADKLTSLVIGTGNQPYKDTCATADFATVMAIAGRVYRPYDAAYAQKCLKAASRAWTWAAANSNSTFDANPPGITTGAYEDMHCDDERLWAAAELYRTTGEPKYEHYFLDHYREYLGTVAPDRTPSWSMVAPLALWTYVLGNGANADAQNAIRQQTLRAADGIVDRAAHNAYRITLTTRDYIWGSNSVAGNYSLELLIADRLHHDERYTHTAIENIHYMLGRNTFALSWVTQVGEEAVKHPHHRPSAADGRPLPWPGLLVGGPNPGRQDSYMKLLLPAGLPPQKNYIDVTGAYACNEIAINWNAPLVFVLASQVE